MLVKGQILVQYIGYYVCIRILNALGFPFKFVEQFNLPSKNKYMFFLYSLILSFDAMPIVLQCVWKTACDISWGRK